METDAFTPEGELLEHDAPETLTGSDPVEYAGATPDKPILKCPKTGKFLPGTGTSGKGGRPKGAKDRASAQLKEIVEDLVARRGAQMLEDIADRSPENAMAIIAKILPPEDLREAFRVDRKATGESGPVVINIGLTKAPERLSHDDKPPVVRELPDGRTEALNPPVSTYEGKASKHTPPIVNRSPEVERRRTDGGYGRRHRGASEPINYRDEDVI